MTATSEFFKRHNTAGPVKLFFFNRLGSKRNARRFIVSPNSFAERVSMKIEKILLFNQLSRDTREVKDGDRTQPDLLNETDET